MDKQKLLQLYPDYNKVYGPYGRDDGRKHVILNNTDLPKGDKNKLKTISYPKALKEIDLGRVLLPNETVDHDDRNFSNNDPNNLIVRDRSDHSRLDATRVKVEKVFCIVCDTYFEPSKDQISSQAGNHAGPFCSRQCSGMYGSAIQNNKVTKTDRTKINKTYYKLDKK